MKGRALFILVVLFRVFQLDGQVNNPVIVSCDGLQFICAPAPETVICTDIIVDPDDPLADSIAFFQITWGDGTPAEIIPANPDSLSVDHIYNLSGYFGACLYEVPFVILLETYYYAGTDTVGNPLLNPDPLNSGFVVTFRLPPTPTFVASPFPCTGYPANFQGSVSGGEPGAQAPDCPPGGIVFEQWLINDDSSLLFMGNELEYQFDSVGNYTVQYCVGNSCDTVCIEKVIQVSPPPDVVLQIDTSLTQIIGSTYRVCLYDTATSFDLDVSESVFQDSFLWEVEGPAGGWTWVQLNNGLDSSITQASVSLPGVYHLTILGKNECAQPDLEEITVEAVEDPDLVLFPQVDTCAALDYVPVPFLDSAIYRINGIVFDSFPVYLPLADTPYLLEAQLTSFCSDKVVWDTFMVQTVPEVAIFYPTENRILCQGEDTLWIEATPGLNWTGGGSNLHIDGQQVYFVPKVPGEFLLIGSRGVGVCRKADTLHILVEAPLTIQVETPEIACIYTHYTPTPFYSEATYWVDDVQIDSFPIFLEQINSPYLISAVMENSCGVVMDSAFVQVILPEPVVIDTSGAKTVCRGSGPVGLFAQPDLGTWQGQYLTQNSDTAFFTPAEAGIFDLIYARGEGLCRTTDTLHLQVVPEDSVQAGDDVLLCQTQQVFQPVNPYPNIANYSGFAMVDQLVDLTLLDPDTSYPYILTHVGMPKECRTDTFFLEIAIPPPSGFDFDRDTLCAGEVVTLEPIVAEGVGYEIDWGDGTPVAGILAHTYSDPGIWTVFYTIQSFNPLNGMVLCEASAQDTVFVPEPFESGEVDFMVFPEKGCAPLQVQVQNLTISQELPFVWSLGSNAPFVGNSPPPYVLEENADLDTTYYEIVLQVKNGCGVVETSKTVEVWPRPEAGLVISDSVLCSGEAATFEANSDGYPQVQWLYTSDGRQAVLLPDSSITWPFLAGFMQDTVLVRLVASNNCGVDTTSAPLAITPPNVVALASTPKGTQFCEGDTLLIINQSTPGAEISWKLDGQPFQGSDTLEWFNLSPGTFLVTLQADGCGYDSLDIAFSVYGPPDLEVFHEPTACPDDTIQFIIQTTAEGVQFWAGNGYANPGKIHHITYPSSGIFSPSVLVMSAEGCTNGWNGTVWILPEPDALGTVTADLCLGDTAYFEGITSVSGSSCQWHFSNGQQADACQAQWVYPQPGLFASILTVTSPDGCVGRDTLPVFVRENPIAGIQYEWETPCVPALIKLKSEASNTTEVQWFLEDNLLASLSGLEWTIQEAGTHHFSLVVSNDGLCFDTAQLSVVTYPSPTFDWKLEPYCTREEGVDLYIQTDSSHSVWITGTAYEANGVVHVGLPDGPYTLHVQNFENCAVDSQIVILPNQELNLVLPEDTFSILLGQSLQLAAQVNMPNVDFQWFPPSYLDAPMSNLPQCSPPMTVQYAVVATDSRGCSKMDSVWVFVDFFKDRAIFIPNAFTPNADGVNDIFYVRGKNPSVLEIEIFQVYDKYNELVFDLKTREDNRPFSINEPEAGWDGTFRGVKAEAGSYRYIISVVYLNGERSFYDGTIQLIR